MLISLKPEFFCDFEHILVKGTEDNILSFGIFPKIKSSGNMNSIKASATCKFFVLNYDLFYGFIYRLVINIFEHFIKFVCFFHQPRVIVFVVRYFVGSAQRYICFYSEQKRTQTKIGIIPQGTSFAISFLVEQDGKQNGRIEISYHILESVCSRFVISSPEIYGLFWSSRQFWLTVGCSQNHSASSSFFHKPFFESLLMSNLHPRNRSSANFRLRFLNSSSLHNRNIEKPSNPELQIHPFKTETTQ
jgi:hypothetical protein